MDLTCRCNPLENYVCVACKVKRGDYKDWMLVKDEERCTTCGVVMRDLSYETCSRCRRAKVSA